MTEAKRLIIDVTTGKVKEESFVFVPQDIKPTPKGVDYSKLKAALVAANIIAAESDVE